MSLRQHRNDEHISAHQKRPGQQRPASAYALHEEDEEECAADDLAHAEEATEQESVLTCADGLEDLGRDWMRVRDIDELGIFVKS